MKIIDHQTQLEENQEQTQQVEQHPNQRTLSHPLLSGSSRHRHYLLLTNIDIPKNILLSENIPLHQPPSSIDKNIKKSQNGGKKRNSKKLTSGKIKDQMLKEVVREQLDLIFQI